MSQLIVGRRMSLVVAACAALVVMAAPGVARAAGYHFATSYVDSQLAGGEPTVMADPAHGTIIYTSHEGTTHLYRNGLVAPLDFGTNYRNQVNIWWSPDNGASWFRDNLATFQGARPDESLGFSDPDLTQDENGRVYDTGIDLANDALFSSIDGGKSWDKGTAQCHDGDRPWLAGGPKDTAWLATDTVEGPGSGHQVFQTTDGGNSCNPSGVVDSAANPDGSTSYSGFGKLYYDHQNHRLVEPAIFNDTTGNPKAVGVSISDAADQTFTPVPVAPTAPNGIYAHWPAITIDSGNNIYLVWDTNPRIPNSSTTTSPKPCGPGPDGSDEPAPNQVMMAVSQDFGKTWSAPITVANPGTGLVFWPWVTAGTGGRVNVVYYQTDKVADTDCNNVTVSVKDAFITGATSPGPMVTTVDPVGRPIHVNSTVCQGGTGCVATGQDRRLGDYLTNNIDPNGCVMIATGDTTQPDVTTGMARPTSLPFFIHQNGGPSLTGGVCAPAPPAAPGQPGQTSTGTGGASGSSAFAFGPGGVTGSCIDREAPKSRIRFYRASRRGLFFRGTSDDPRCINRRAGVALKGDLARVSVEVAREAPHRKCRFLRANGSFMAPTSCLSSGGHYLPAKGKAHWTFTFRHRLPPGVYKAWVRGVDAAGNIEHKDHRRNFIRFHIV